MATSTQTLHSQASKHLVCPIRPPPSKTPGLPATLRYGPDGAVEFLQKAISQGIPPVLLMAFSESDREGHYRVLVDINSTAATFLDPWDREGWPRILVLALPDMMALWNYTEGDVLPVGGLDHSHIAVSFAPWATRAVGLRRGRAAMIDVAVEAPTFARRVDAFVGFGCDADVVGCADLLREAHVPIKVVPGEVAMAALVTQRLVDGAVVVVYALADGVVPSLFRAAARPRYDSYAWRDVVGAHCDISWTS
jgi:hypothetical protein